MATSSVLQFGRVELDPMRVPAPASAASDAHESFEQALEGARAGLDDAPPSDDAPPAGDVAAPAPAPVAETQPQDDAPPAPAEDAPTARPIVANPRPELETGARGRDRAAGKEPGAAVATLAAGEPAGARMAGAAASPAPAPVAHGATAGAHPAAAIALVAAVPTAAAPPTAAAATGAAAGEPVAADRARVAAPMPAARAFAAERVRLAEQARDSMFKQIAMRLADGRGEMHVLLDPPELGELDLRLLVDEHGTLRLSIWAERAETSLALEKHLHELRQSLAHSGLAIAHAEVRSDRDRRAHERHGAFGEAPAGGTPPAGEHETHPLPRTGWWTAEGLELWV